MELKQQLEGLELTANLAVNEPCVDSVRRYTVTPLRLSVDVTPRVPRNRWLLYRIGMHGAMSQLESGLADEDADYSIVTSIDSDMDNGASNSSVQQREEQRSTALHLQVSKSHISTCLKWTTWSYSDHFC